jgi:prephenate dehydratase
MTTTYRDDLELETLEHITTALHKVKPDTQGYSVVAIENAQLHDQNLVFRLMKNEEAEVKDEKTVLISFDFILDFFNVEVQEKDDFIPT